MVLENLEKCEVEGTFLREVGATLEVAFYQFLTNRRRMRDTLKDAFKRKAIGGESITGPTLAAALGRQMRGTWAPISLKDAPFDVAAISFNTPGAPRAYSAAKCLKALGKIVVAGGPHPSVLPAEALKYFDAVCIGPGDVQFPRMVADAEQGKLERIYHGGAGDWVICRRQRLRGLSIIQLSRGCHRSCRFCVVPSLFPGQIDEKPMRLVKAELAMTSSSVSIIDDSFCVSTERGQQVLSLLRDFGKSFYCQISAESASEGKNLKLLAQAGCTLVGVGIESISHESQAFLGKPRNRNPKETISRIHDTGMGSYINLVFGSDGETYDIFERTIRFIEQARPTVVSPHVLTPFPGTKIFDYFAKRGRLLFEENAFPDAWSLFDCRHVVIIPDPLTPEELDEGFSMFTKELFSLRNTIRRARRESLPVALLSSVLKNEW
ncbi:MAG: B12-binding domain-containing radical SAM protein [Planctomycetota bacterium]